MAFNNQWHQLTVREKIIFMVLVPVLILAMVQLFEVNPMEARSKKVQAQIQKNAKQIELISQQIQLTQQQLAKNSTTKLNNQQKGLELKVKQQTEKMQQFLNKLVPPQLMAKTVEGMLKKRGKLKLISLANLAAIPLPEEQEKNEGNKNNSPLVFKHSLKVSFKGRYFDVLNYLKDLERSNVGFFWDAMDYQVKNYPDATITLKLFTLGTARQWMGAADEK